MTRFANLLLATTALISATATAADPTPDLARWPQSWADTYRHFEKFITEQGANVPPSDLQITPRGEIQTNLPDEINPQRHTSVSFYKEGAGFLEMALGGGLFNGGRQRFFQSGTFAACLKTSDELLGYQFRHPITWFQVEPTNPGGVHHSRLAASMSARVIEQPQPPEDYWPNDRLLQYWDFHVFPHDNPLHFFQENRKVSPSITLGVTNAGVVEREKLDDSLESLLHWRIYFNGRLVDKGSAKGDLRHAVKQGTGTYSVFLGVDGPSGFMPISNFLQFPLFPERGGAIAVCPNASNDDGVPDFLTDALSPDQMGRLRASSVWSVKRVAYNKAALYNLDAIGPVDDPKLESLVFLWSAWAWSVDLAKVAPVSDIGQIRMVKEAAGK